jgi:hypothetical protein
VLAITKADKKLVCLLSNARGVDYDYVGGGGGALQGFFDQFGFFS